MRKRRRERRVLGQGVWGLRWAALYVCSTVDPVDQIAGEATITPGTRLRVRLRGRRP